MKDDLRQEKLNQLAPALVPWFQKNGRRLPWRENAIPYHVWLSEIMLQQTRIEAVKPYYARFLQEIPDIAALAAADPEKLQKLWEGLGYYSRVRNLQTAAQQIMTEYGGTFPDTWDEIRKLKGIGDYTAGAIASMCFNRPTPAVDGNVLRVLSRITGDARPITDEKTRKAVRADLAAVYPGENCGDFTQAIMELGETVCLPNAAPDCGRCPCRDFCTAADGSWEKYPVKAEKKARRREEYTVFLLYSGDGIAIRKRPEKGILAGLWEYPNVPGRLTLPKVKAQLAAWDLDPESVRKTETVMHIFTHVEWKMHCYEAVCRNRSEAFVWVPAEELKTRIALPTAFRKIRKEI